MSGRRAVLVAAILGAGAVHSADPQPVTLPLTIDHVWFRQVAGKAWIRLSNSGGDLTIREDALSFATHKKTVELPAEHVRMVTFGKIRGDVNTEWALIGIGAERTETIVAIRDGRKLGYGQKTWEIFEQLEEALAAIPAAQYRVQPGFRALDEFNLQFTMAVPESWHSYLDEVVFVGNRAPYGTLLLAAESMRREEDGKPTTADPAVLERVLAGAVPAFFVRRREAEGGMGCAGFSAKALERVLGLAAEGALVPGGGKLVGVPATSTETIDRCNALRLRGRVASRKGVETEIDLHVAAEDGTLFVFGLRAVPERYEEYREVLAGVLATIQFSVAE